MLRGRLALALRFPANRITIADIFDLSAIFRRGLDLQFLAQFLKINVKFCFFFHVWLRD